MSSSLRFHLEQVLPYFGQLSSSFLMELKFNHTTITTSLIYTSNLDIEQKYIIYYNTKIFVTLYTDTKRNLQMKKKKGKRQPTIVLEQYLPNMNKHVGHISPGLVALIRIIHKNSCRGPSSLHVGHQNYIHKECCNLKW